MTKLRCHLATVTLIASVLMTQGTYAGSEKKRDGESPEVEKSVDLKERSKPTVPDLLRTRLKQGDAIMWHLYQSGFAIKTARHLLIFDYGPGADVAEGGGGLGRGLVNPEEISEEDVVVFASHCHLDHWDTGCLAWREKVPKIHYVVSPDVSGRREGLTSLGPNEAANVGDVYVKALRSTDVGVAFVVKTDGLTIYHSGDNACWNWGNDPKAEAQFVTEHLKPLKGEKIDIAMHVCDPRLRSSGWGGFVAFAREFKPRLLIPMHMEGRYEFTREMESVLKEKGIGAPFWPIQRRGDCIVFRGGEIEKPTTRSHSAATQSRQRREILSERGARWHSAPGRAEGEWWISCSPQRDCRPLRGLGVGWCLVSGASTGLRPRQEECRPYGGWARGSSPMPREKRGSARRGAQVANPCGIS